MINRYSSSVFPIIFSVLKSITEEDAALQLQKPWFNASSSFHFEVGENCPLLGCYAAINGNSLLALRDNLSVPSSRVKKGLIGCPEVSIRNYHYSLRNISEDCSNQPCVCSELSTWAVSGEVLWQEWRSNPESDTQVVDHRSGCWYWSLGKPWHVILNDPLVCLHLHIVWQKRELLTGYDG
jgi:hypothetical protein